MQRPPLVAGEREVALDHHALGDRRVAGEAELGRDRALVHLPVARERRLLAVERERAAGDGAVLERAPHQRRRGDRPAVVGERGRARVGELAHLGQLRAAERLRDRGQEADRDDRLAARLLDERRAARRPSRRPDRCSASRGSRSSRRRRRRRCRRRSSPRPRGPACGGGRAGRRRRARATREVGCARLDPRDHAVGDGDRDALAAEEAALDDERSRSGRSCTKSITPPPPRPAPRLAREQVVEDRHPHERRPPRTWSRISESGESATRPSISTPRFIGPGCMTFCPAAAARA